MAYATVQDMLDRFQADELGELDPMDPEPETRTADATGYPRVTTALGDASAEIDASLSPLYALPLEGGPWPLLRRLACDLARYELYDAAPTEAVASRAKASREMLKMIREGEVAFLDAAGKAPARTTAARFRGPDPVMTPENLEGL